MEAINLEEENQVLKRIMHGWYASGPIIFYT